MGFWGYSGILWRILRDSSGFFGILWDSLGFLWVFGDTEGFFDGFLGILWDSYGFLGILKDSLTNSLGFWGILRDSEGFWGILRDSDGFWGILRGSEGFWGVLRGSEGFSNDWIGSRGHLRPAIWKRQVSARNWRDDLHTSTLRHTGTLGLLYPSIPSLLSLINNKWGKKKRAMMSRKASAPFESTKRNSAHSVQFHLMIFFPQCVYECVCVCLCSPPRFIIKLWLNKRGGGAGPVPGNW